MVHSIVLRSNAAHHPSLKRDILIAPHLSTVMNSSGTPVSVISNTSSRQQLALQVAQVTPGSGMPFTFIVIASRYRSVPFPAVKPASIQPAIMLIRALWSAFGPLEEAKPCAACSKCL